MSSHADTIRRALATRQPRARRDTFGDAEAALDALLAENQRLKEEARQMTLAYHETVGQRNDARAENQRLREALERIAVSGATDSEATEKRLIAREALAGDTE